MVVDGGYRQTVDAEEEDQGEAAVQGNAAKGAHPEATGGHPRGREGVEDGVEERCKGAGVSQPRSHRKAPASSSALPGKSGEIRVGSLPGEDDAPEDPEAWGQQIHQVQSENAKEMEKTRPKGYYGKAVAGLIPW